MTGTARQTLHPPRPLFFLGLDRGLKPARMAGIAQRVQNAFQGAARLPAAVDDNAQDVLHALCNAHHPRELQALIDIEKEDWARKMQRLSRRACHAANLAREQGVTLSPGLIALIERCYDAILMEGFAFHEAQPALISTARKRAGRVPRRTGHNLLRRLHGRKLDVSRFLSNPAVPFTNNLAERDGRMMKPRQKISGGFRPGEGAEDFAVIRSLLSTAGKQGWDILCALAGQPDRLITELRIA